MDRRVMPDLPVTELPSKRQRLDAVAGAQQKQAQPPPVKVELGLSPLTPRDFYDHSCNLNGADLHTSPNSGGECSLFQSPAAGSWTQDGFSQDPNFLASQEELRCFLFSLANSAVPTRASSPDAVDSGVQLERLSQASTKDGRDSWHAPLSEGRRIYYLKIYVSEVVPWLDMFDSECTFRHQIPALAQGFPALSNAIPCLLNKTDRALELYQEAIRRLSPLLQVHDTKVVAACVLLCCLEMMSARAQDWRRHLEGCAALFSAFGIQGFSPECYRQYFGVMRGWTFAVRLSLMARKLQFYTRPNGCLQAVKKRMHIDYSKMSRLRTCTQITRYISVWKRRSWFRIVQGSSNWAKITDVLPSNFSPVGFVSGTSFSAG
ncbi:uncharacterized protein BP01DRAFT_425968 [Aspergillus saccharolyticus JOP 1030-1]|uniref:Transcription factor domain-containing protein n=1 Tax=Aspergillus saccharolyticus JOP 1030-1 TaxID=1450539 RepID=A0A318ZED5_9EURO|nr:hypothetical protein BP01DRAFT_425968 [Aspergillus saccharolyticus JOP 1030-1]PYH41940.1 hypothetical protein BP01DRAFT_425968 [Aspergillus saccharolyticus JOP 1030-1]